METKHLINHLYELSASIEDALENGLDEITISESDCRLLTATVKRLKELSTYEGRQNVHAA